MNNETPRKNGTRLERSLLLTGLILLTACVGLVATVPLRVRAAEDKIKESAYAEDYSRFAALLAEVFVEVQDKYVDEIEPQKLFEATLDGLFQGLDPYSAYLGEENFRELEKSTEGEFSGIGIHINISDGVLTVVSPIPGTPAARAGMLAWDRIIEIEGESTEGMTTSDAVNELTGPIGTEVNIIVYRESENRRIPMTIVRDRIKIESVYSNVDEEDYVTPYFKGLLEQGIGYLRLTKFSDDVATEMARALKKMRDEEVRGLILDFRHNSGGLLSEGIDVSDLFLGEDEVIVATKGRLQEQNRVYKAKNKALVDWPIIVLVNQGSASATEIVAGALQDHGRAVLIGINGENTFGKALVQTITPLNVSLESDENGNDLPNALRLTTARYYSPNNIGPDGKSMHGVGLKPDLTVEVDIEEQADLLRKGLLLGDPPLEKDDQADEAVNDDEEADEEDDGKVDEDKDIPFYLKDNGDEDVLWIEDKQLRYAVDVLRALLITRHTDAA